MWRLLNLCGCVWLVRTLLSVWPCSVHTYLGSAFLNVPAVMQLSSFTVWQSYGGVDHGGLGVLIPWKYVGGARVCFDLPPIKKSHSFIQNCCWITASFTSSTMKDLCQKWKVKLIFRGAWNSLMAWPDWPWPPYFTTALRRCLPPHVLYPSLKT